MRKNKFQIGDLVEYTQKETYLKPRKCQGYYVGYDNNYNCHMIIQTQDQVAEEFLANKHVAPLTTKINERPSSLQANLIRGFGFLKQHYVRLNLTDQMFPMWSNETKSLLVFDSNQLRVVPVAKTMSEILYELQQQTL